MIRSVSTLAAALFVVAVAGCRSDPNREQGPFPRHDEPAGAMGGAERTEEQNLPTYGAREGMDTRGAWWQANGQHNSGPPVAEPPDQTGVQPDQPGVSYGPPPGDRTIAPNGDDQGDRSTPIGPEPSWTDRTNAPVETPSDAPR